MATATQTPTQTPTYTLTEERISAIIEAAVQTAVERALAARDEHYRDLTREALEDEALGRAILDGRTGERVSRQAVFAQLDAEDE